MASVYNKENRFLTESNNFLDENFLRLSVE